MDTKEMIKLAAKGLVVEPQEMAEKTAVEPMVGGVPPPPAGGGGMPPMDPMAGGGMPTMPGAGAPPMPMDPAMMGGMPPADPMAGGGGMPPMDPAMLEGLMGGGPPPEGGEGAPPEGAPPEEEPINDPLTDVDDNNKPDTMVPLEAITEHDVKLIEATKGKRTADAAPPTDPGAGGGAMPSLGPGSIGGPPADAAAGAMPPKIGEILKKMDEDLS